jgi:ribosomal protein S18 acetylase RimI-like enzyme
MAKNIRLRAYRPEDAAAVAHLLNVISHECGGTLELPADAIENVVRTEVLDVSRDTRLVTDDEGRLVAVGLVRVPPEGGFRVTLEGGVHPDHRRRGIGRELLAWQLDRATSRHSELAQSLAWVAEVNANADATSAIGLYERAGFAVERFFLEMSALTEPAPAAAAVSGFSIVPFDPVQEREMHAVHQAAFQGSWGFQPRTFESWAALTVGSDTFLGGLARIAVCEGRMVGYVLPYADGPTTVYLGQIGTAEDWRGRGVATALLVEVLRAAGRSGYANAALETDVDSPTGAPRLYEKLGFTTEQRVVLYRKPL